MPKASGVQPLENLAVHGIGTATNSRPVPPTPAELLATAAVAEPGGTDAQLDVFYDGEPERGIARELRRRYELRLRSVQRRQATGGDDPPTPDALSLRATWTVEFKTATSERAIHTHLRFAMLQSDRVVIDARQVEEETARRGMRRALRDYGGHYAEVFALVSGGSGLYWARG